MPNSQGKVLVIDDDEISLAITRSRLESAGFEVVTRDRAIGTGRDISRHNPDVILLDLNMPAMSGELLASVIAERDAPPPIIVHSGKDAALIQEKAREINALGAISKSEDDQHFLKQFRRLYDTR